MVDNDIYKIITRKWSKPLCYSISWSLMDSGSKVSHKYWWAFGSFSNLGGKCSLDQCQIDIKMLPLSIQLRFDIFCYGAVFVIWLNIKVRAVDSSKTRIYINVISRVGPTMNHFDIMICILKTGLLTVKYDFLTTVSKGIFHTLYQIPEQYTE